MEVKLGKNAELEIVYLETDKSNSSQDKQVYDHKKINTFFKDSIDTTRSIFKLKKIFNQPSRRQNLSIFTINIAGITNYFYFLHIYNSLTSSVARRYYRTLCYVKRIGYL